MTIVIDINLGLGKTTLLLCVLELLNSLLSTMLVEEATCVRVSLTTAKPLIK